MPEAEQIFDIPDDLRAFLQNEGVLELFEQRPLDQQKGYVRWLHHTRSEAARANHLIYLVEELRAGVYMLPSKEKT